MIPDTPPPTDNDALHMEVANLRGRLATVEAENEQLRVAASAAESRLVEAANTISVERQQLKMTAARMATEMMSQVGQTPPIRDTSPKTGNQTAQPSACPTLPPPGQGFARVLNAFRVQGASAF